MSAIADLRLDPWREIGPHGTTADEAPTVEEPISRIVERVNEILGYDIFAAQSLAAGYREYADESLLIAEASTAASAEMLPDE